MADFSEAQDSNVVDMAMVLADRHFKECEHCGRMYTRAEWAKLSLQGYYGGGKSKITEKRELRSCHCGEILSICHRAGGVIDTKEAD